jgi:hypothetical protein
LSVLTLVIPCHAPPVIRGRKTRVHTPAESGKALARLIVDPALVSTNGKYFEGLREIPSSAESYDKDRAEELWRESATLTGIERLP